MIKFEYIISVILLIAIFSYMFYSSAKMAETDKQSNIQILNEVMAMNGKVPDARKLYRLNTKTHRLDITWK